MDFAEGFVLTLAEFEWDEWNEEKNRIKHHVQPQECEEVFFNHPLFGEIPQSEERFGEQRYYVLGETNEGRKLTVIFTIRRLAVRVISARNMSRRERRGCEKRFKEGS
ncbi:MAG: BrnT family toxin [Elusimicrobia bacterium]|nr:BrnT family toxin [Elusimicrobiota bacterium]